MTANSKAKLKTLYVYRMLEEETDAEHGLTMAEIIERLAEEGVSAERKGIYRDLDLLREFGLDVQKLRRTPTEYAVVRRDFDLPSLMLMVDAVASSKFMTRKQADILVGNIKSLASSSQQDYLERRIHVAGRINAETNGVFDAIDAIHRALFDRRKLSFRYLHYDVDGKRRAAGPGSRLVTPVSIAYDGGFYYLTAWDEAHQDLREFRLDRMEDIAVSDSEATCNDTIAEYAFDEDAAYEYFGRFGGPERLITFAVQADKVEIIRDRFGDHAEIFRDATGVYAKAKVRVSAQFFGWVAGLDGTVTIEAPDDVREEYRAYLRKLLGE